MKPYPISFPTAKLVKYEKSGNLAIVIKFPFSRDMLEIVKTIPGRKYNDVQKFWHCPLSAEAVDILVKNKFKLDDPLIQFYKKTQDVFVPALINIPGLKGELRTFQNHGVGFTEYRNGRALICDDMGMGKTVQALAWLQLHHNIQRTVIVCTSSMKIKWGRECKAWLSQCNPQILYGSPCETMNLTGNIIIVNYDILSNTFMEETIGDKKTSTEIPRSGWVDFLVQYDPELVITDEFHYFKNDDAARTKAVKKLCRKNPYFIGLSGTPVETSPLDVFNAAKLCDPTVFPSQWQFKMRYCNPVHNGFGWSFKGSSNEDELYQKLRKVMIRRLKKDHLSELPPKIFSIIPMEISNRREYEHAENEFMDYVEIVARNKFETEQNQVQAALDKELQKMMKKFNVNPEAFQTQALNLDDEKERYVNNKLDRAENAGVMVQMGLLKQLAAQGKLKQAMEWIHDFLERGEKLVVFAHNQDIVDEIMAKFKGLAIKIDGRTPMGKRQQNIDDFQSNPKIKLAVITLAAAEGITLTAASNIAILQFPWVSTKLDQIIDRIHRIGQTKQVTVYFLVAHRTIDEVDANRIDERREMISKVIDGTKADPAMMINELMDSIKMLRKFRKIGKEMLDDLLASSNVTIHKRQIF